MIADEIRKKLQNIIREASLEGQRDYCTTIRNLLIQSFGTSTTAKREFESRAVVKEKQAELKDIEELLTFNGFTNTKRQDYYNNEFGLLLEDMHDENVISKDEVLFFIDTVFYLLDDNK